MRKFRTLLVGLFVVLVVTLSLIGLVGCECAHEWSDWTTVTESTCTEKGEKSRTCSKCNESETAEIEVIAHTFDKQIVSDAFLASGANCSQKALYYYSCECGAKGTETFENGELGAHVYGAWQSVSAGEHQRVCTINSAHVETGACSGGEATCTQKAICSTCNSEYGAVLGHDWGAWEKDASADTHTRVCANNPSHTETANCTGGTATCSQKAICTTCNSAYGSVNATSHDWGAWEKDASADTHTRVCANNPLHTETVACSGGTANCTDKKVCSTCNSPYGSVNATAHEWGAWAKDAGADTHTRVCSRDASHTETVSCAGGTATCTEKAVCATCNEEYGSVNATTHEWGNWVKDSGADTHTRVCSRNASHTETVSCTGGTATCTSGKICTVCSGEYGEPLGHDWDEGEETLAPTCTEKGEKTYTCERLGCGETKTEEIDALGHEWLGATCEDPKTCDVCGATEGEALGHDWIDATCETAKTCDTCGATEGEALGHDWDEGEETLAPTCTEKGETTYTCERLDCGETKTEEIDALGHEWLDATCETAKTCDTCAATEGNALGHDWIDATCETAKTCDTCGATEGEALGHDWDEGEETLAPTCTEKGEKTYTCERLDCGETKTEEIDALGHEWLDATCETAKTCDTCAATEGNALGHFWSAWQSNGDGTHTRVCSRANHPETEDCIGGEATCEDAPVCTICKEHYDEALGHEWGEGEVTTPATCTTNGVRTYTCSTCSETKTEVIQATGHDYDVSVTDPTCTTKGYTTYTCSCGDSYVGDEVDALGHEWDGELTCTSGHSCLNCSASESALGHDYKVVDSVEVGCETDGEETHECTRCQDSYVTLTASAYGHDITGVTAREELVSGTCEFVQVYTCKNCGDDVYGDTVYHHSYTAKLLDEANCCEEGLKEHTCSLCGDTYTEEIKPIADAHVWNEGVKEGSVITYTCTVDGCGATKTAIDVSEETVSGELSADDLAGNEVQFKDASMSLDDTTRGLIEEKVTLSAGILEGDALAEAKAKLTPEEQEQLGSDGKIYNFTMADGEGNLITSFGDDEETCGWVTITIPYELDDEEDVNNIAVWYISEGKPVSIKATYANGYVTFKTNHFSWYSVAKLDPDEMCALYEHNFLTSKVEGDCLNDGYTLKVCIRCQYSEKTVTSEANGHDYEEVVTPATCTTSGKIVYTCVDCSHSYQTKLKATGHDFDLIEDVAPTCESAGHKTYDCVYCDESYVTVLAQLKHVYVDSQVLATCQEGGYNLHICNNCNYEYKDNLTPALGHAWGDIVWTWASDYSSAEGEIVCVNDDTHVVTLTGTITSESISATCASGGTTIYTAKAVYNGATYVDVQRVQTGTVAHDYKTQKFDEDNHWLECDCGDVSEVTAHDYSEELDRREPTCSEEGEVALACSCGAATVEIIPATGEHDFVEGVCSVCGKEEDLTESCEHSNMSKVTINFADYGACGGGGEAEVCDDCGYVVINPASMRLECQNNEYQQGEPTMGEDGWMSARMYQTCKDCGMILDANARMKQDGCTMMQEVYYSIYVGQTVVVENAYSYMEQVSHSSSPETIELSEYTPCGGEIYIGKCLVCGEITRVINLGLQCQVDEANATMSTYTDEFGNEHQVMSATCSVCECTLSMDSCAVPSSSVCYVDVFTTYKLTSEGVTVLEFSAHEMQENHELEEYYELDGDTCEEGWTYWTTCKNCGNGTGHGGYGHALKNVNVDMSEYSACGGTFTYQECAICGIQTNASGMPNCSVFHSQPSFEEIEKDGVIHQIANMTCTECGLEYLMDAWQEVISVCESKMHQVIEVSNDGEVLATFDIVQNVGENHEWVESFEDDDGDCTNGYLRVQTCSLCGKRIEYNYGGHHTNGYENIPLPEDSCGGSIYGEVCKVCNKVIYIENVGYECDVDLSNFETSEIDGVMHMICSETCSTCGYAYYVDTWDEVMSACEKRTYVMVRIYKDDYVFVDSETSRYMSNHVALKQEFVPKGETCLDGYDCYESCEACGYNSNYNYHGHVWEKDVIHFANYGLCEGFIEHMYCRFCEATQGSMMNEGCSWQYVESGEDGVEEHVCSVCGATKKNITNVYQEGCYIINEYVSEYYVDGSLVLEYSHYRSGFDNHDYQYQYNMNGDSCEYGFSVVITCANCDYEVTNYYDYHQTFNIHSYDLTIYGACRGYVRIASCPCGENVSESIYTCGYNYNENDYVDSEGREVSVNVLTCDACGLRYTRSYYDEKEEGSCKTTRYVSVTVNVGATLVCDIDYTLNIVEHSYVESATLLNGGTCKDGVRVTSTCSVCGDSYFNDYDYHYTVLDTVYDLADYGATCGSYAYYKVCACGSDEYVELDDECDFGGGQWTEFWIPNAIYGWHYNLTSNNDVYFDSYANLKICAVTEPNQCNLAIRYARYWLKDEGACVAREYETWQFGYDRETGEYIYELTIKTGAVRAFHNLVETTSEGEWDEGTTDTTSRICSDCGASHVRVTYRYDDKLDYIEETTITNTVDDGLGNFKTFTMREEMVYPYSGSSVEYGDVNMEYTYWDGSESWWKSDVTYEVTGNYGEDGFKFRKTTIYTSSEGSEERNISEFIIYCGRSYNTYSYTSTNKYGMNEWWETTRVYDFTGICTVTITERSYYDEVGSTRVENACYVYEETLVHPTCTQNGLMGDRCQVCDNIAYERPISPFDHVWVRIDDDHYYCSVCGLQNENGSSGQIIMEDLTSKLGEGEYYVVGYYNQGNVEFMQYVSILLKNGEINNEIMLDGVDFLWDKDGYRSVYFSKAQVTQLASALGYEEGDYDVKFAFVPIGADGSFTYAITFGEEEVIDSVDQTSTFLIGGATSESHEFTFTVEEGQTWQIEVFNRDSVYTGYVYVGIYNSVGDIICGNNVLSSQTFSGFTEGETYTVRFHFSLYNDIYDYLYVGFRVTVEGNSASIGGGSSSSGNIGFNSL